MKSFKSFKEAINENSYLAFTYNDGGSDQVVVIKGSKSQLKKVDAKLAGDFQSSNMKVVDGKDYVGADGEPIGDNVQVIGANLWLKM